jgi:O-methyltransferase
MGVDGSPAAGSDAPFLELPCSPLLGSRARAVYRWFVRSLGVPGDAAECGVFDGVTSRALASYLDARASPKRLHMFDSFAGLPDRIAPEEIALAAGDELRAGQFAAPLADVRERMRGCERYELHPGLFAQTFAAFDRPLCFIHADADLYESTAEIIELADRCLVAGGTIVFDDYCNAKFPGVTLAIERFLQLDRYDVEASPGTIQFFATKR